MRDWRRRRQMTQAELAFSAGVSARHLSFVETGRASPSRELVITLAKCLDLSAGHHNEMLLSAGFAPVFAARPLNDPSIEASLRLVNEVLSAHEPNPSLAYDFEWNLVAANRMVSSFLQDVAADLLEPPVNLVRLTLHPRGLAPRIENLQYWHERMSAKVHQRYAETGHKKLAELYNEVVSYRPRGIAAASSDESPSFVLPLRLSSPLGPLVFSSTTMVFGTPFNMELPELAIETFLPADAATAAALQKL